MRYCLKKSNKELRLSLGKIVVSLKGQAINFPGKDNPYKEFITQDKADVKLSLCPEEFSGHMNKERVFDAAGAWKIAKDSSKWVIRTTSAVAVFNKMFSYGKIYQGVKNSSKDVDFSLTYPLAEIIMINLLSQRKGVLAHACGVIYKNRGLLFVGSSGAGKSTIANLWKEKKEAVVLSDDRIIVRKIKGKLWMYGTPWHGDAETCSSRAVILDKIFFLVHSDNNYLRSLKQIEAASRLFVCIFPPFWNKGGMEFTLRFCAQIACQVPFFDLSFLPDKRVIDFITD